MAYDGWGWRPYVPVGDRVRSAQREVEKRRKKGEDIAPVVVSGRIIAKTFWGKSWCQNLEKYSDYANRLPRGRTYVRNGSVVDLQIRPGEIHALVSGSSLYTVKLNISPVAQNRWKAICGDCAGGIDSLVELLQGKFSKGVMERICRQSQGLFPAPSEIKLSCSCPDWAGMCKHVAAVLYGVGARLDGRPELLFHLRGVDHTELIATAGAAVPLASMNAAGAKVLAGDDLGDMFGLDMAETTKTAGGKKAGGKSAAGKKVAAIKKAAGKKQLAAKKNKAPVGRTKRPA